jgi:hypothetical protein
MMGAWAELESMNKTPNSWNPVTAESWNSSALGRFVENLPPHLDEDALGVFRECPLHARQRLPSFVRASGGAGARVRQPKTRV